MAVLCPGFAGRYVLCIPPHTPYTKGSVLKTFIVGLVVIVLGLFLVTNIARCFTKAGRMYTLQPVTHTYISPKDSRSGALDCSLEVTLEMKDDGVRRFFEGQHLA